MEFKLMLKNLSLVLLMSSTLLTQVTYAMEEDPSEDNNQSQIHLNKSTSSEQNDRKELYKSGLSCLREGKLKEGIQNLEKAMELGDGEAAYKLALMYEEGIIIKEDFEEALEFYKKSLELGYVRAEKNYIQLKEKLNRNLIQFTKEGKKKIKLIRKELTKLVKENRVDDIIKLADFYLEKRPVPDVKKLLAIKLYEIASEKGNPNAMNKLAQLYEGEDLAQVYEQYYCDYIDYSDKQIYYYITKSRRYEENIDYSMYYSMFFPIKALILYKEASDLGHGDAKKNLENLCKKLTPSLDEVESCTDDQEASLFLTCLVENKDIKELSFFNEFLYTSYFHPLSSYVRGWMYENGYGVQKDILKAFKEYFEAWFYIEKPVKNIILPDCRRVVEKLYEKIDNIKDLLSQWEIVHRGLVMRYDPEKTRDLFEKIIHEIDKGGKLPYKNEIPETLWKMKLLEEDNETTIKRAALRSLAYMYEKGIGMKSIGIAINLYKKASKLGDSNARDSYDRLINQK